MIVLEKLAELFFDAACEFVGALVLRGVEVILETSEFKNPLLACIGYVFLGAIVGGISVFILRHPLFHLS